MYCAGADLGGDKPAFQRDAKVGVFYQTKGMGEFLCLSTVNHLS